MLKHLPKGQGTARKHQNKRPQFTWVTWVGECGLSTLVSLQGHISLLRTPSCQHLCISSQLADQGISGTQHTRTPYPRPTPDSACHPTKKGCGKENSRTSQPIPPPTINSLPTRVAPSHVGHVHSSSSQLTKWHAV